MIVKRNTIQKQIVFDVLTKMHNHPSAGMVYEAVNAEHPNISRATVFRILAEAADEGKILRLKLNDSTDRYDTTTFHHHHVVCRECGHVADVDIDIDEKNLLNCAVGHEDFCVEKSHIEFVGICSKCRNNK